LLEPQDAERASSPNSTSNASRPALLDNLLRASASMHATLITTPAFLITTLKPLRRMFTHTTATDLKFAIRLATRT